jgi:hypothetical protein
VSPPLTEEASLFFFYSSNCAQHLKHHRTGFFAEEYKAWSMRRDNPTNDMDFAAFCFFWESAINIVSFTATLALQHHYGLKAVEDNPSAA